MIDPSIGRRDRDKAGLALTYPGARWIPPQKARQVGFWRVPFRPFPPPKDLSAIVADLESDRFVDLSTNGTVMHRGSCSAVHETPEDIQAIKHRITSNNSEYTGIVIFPGERSDPKVWVTSDNWNRFDMHNHAHMNSDGSACVLYPPADEWNPVRNDLADFMDQVSLWTLKTEIWVARGAQRASDGWPGSAQGH